MLLVFLFMGFGLQQDAGELPWESLSRNRTPGGTWDAPIVVYDPGDPDARSWYSFTPGAAYHTDDFGETMRPLGEAGMENQIWGDMVVATDAPDILYAATGLREYDDGGEISRWPGGGVYRSEDRGESWARLPFFPGIEDEDDLHFLTSIVTSALGDTVVVATERRILRSVDAGQSWEVVHNLVPLSVPHVHGGIFPIRDVRLHQHPRILKHLFATVRGAGVHYLYDVTDQYMLVSHDGGATWEQLMLSEDEPLMMDRVEFKREQHWEIAADPMDAEVFWIINNRPHWKFWRTGDGGHTWSDLPAVHKQGFNDYSTSTSHAPRFFVHPRGGDTLSIGTMIGHYRGDHLFTDGKLTDKVALLLPFAESYLGFRLVAAEQFNHDGYWVVSWEYEEYRDRIYTTTGAFVSERIWGVCKIPGQEKIVGVRRRADHVPTDHGHSMAATGRAFIGAYDAPHKVSDHPKERLARTRPVYCPPSPSYDILNGGVGYWSDHYWPMNKTLSTFHDPLVRASPPSSAVHRFSVSRQNPDQVWVAARWADIGSGRSGVWRSDDYTDTWEFVHHDPEIITVHVHRASDQVVYTNRGVTRDGGKTWQARTLPDDAAMELQDRLYSHPADASIIWVCGDRGLRRWDNYLQDSTLIADEETYARCHDLLVFPHNPDRIWMGTDSGLWETLDGGNTWTRQNRGIPNNPITAIYLTYEQDSLFVGTFGRGLFGLAAGDVDIGFASLVSREADIELPGEGFMLQGNYPNPFREGTVVGFRAGEAAHIRLEILDVLGRRVVTVTDQAYPRGDHQVRWESAQQASGVYFVHMHVDGVLRQSRKVVRR